jgi:hypothetical protein
VVEPLFLHALLENANCTSILGRPYRDLLSGAFDTGGLPAARKNASVGSPARTHPRAKAPFTWHF